jgi:phosphoribosyl-AMP cyclohydrolase
VTAGDPAWLAEVRWNADGLVAAVAQDTAGRVLTVAWMNRDALLCTVREGRAVYWSRSRKRLWAKGEESGFVQRVVEVRLDCDGDAVLLTVEQEGGIACHTGRAACFYRKLGESGWEETDPVLQDPGTIYGKRS